MTGEHDPWCKWPTGAPCLRFSTDGTRLGADIAHTMGTLDESAIVRGEAPNDDSVPPFVSDIDAEQADWDSDQVCGEVYEREGFRAVCTVDAGWPHWQHSSGEWHWGRPPEGEPGPPVDHDRPKPYPASKLEWN